MAALAVLATLASACDSVTPVGEVRNRTVDIGRDGAASAVVGGKVVWVFGDTFTANGGVRNSAAIADRSDPTNVTDTLVNGVPHQAVPFNSTEAAANQDGSGQWVIWPTSIVATGPDDALVFSTKFHATNDGWTDGSLVVSRISKGETQSTRVAEPFAAPESTFASAPFLHKGIVYLMDCGGLNIPPQAARRVMPGLPSTGDLVGFNGTGKCRLGRVPVAQVTDHDAYEFWTGAAWLPSSLAATPLIPGSNTGLSVAWDPYFGKFIALSVPGLSNEIQLSTAPSIVGPWTSPKTIFKAETNIYALRVHPALGAPDLSTLAVSYFRQDAPGKPGAIVLTKVVLDKR